MEQQVHLLRDVRRAPGVVEPAPPPEAVSATLPDVSLNEPEAPPPPDCPPPPASCSTTSQCVTGLTCTDGVCCSSSSCPACQACNILGNLGTCTGKPAGTSDGACSGTCMTGACAAGGRCAPASASTSCGTGTCTNGSQGNGQWASPTFHPRNCNGSGTGDAACVLSTGNLGCSGNFVCLDGASCRTNCVREIDCVDGYYCASDGTCQQRMSTSSMSVCTKDQQCQSRVCMGTCVQCDKDDDCPRHHGND